LFPLNLIEVPTLETDNNKKDINDGTG